MQWLLRLLIQSNQQLFLAVMFSMAVTMFLPIEWQNIWTLGGIAAWITLISAAVRWAMVTVMKGEIQVKTDPAGTGSDSRDENTQG